MAITRLHLENFQTIAQPTSIELSEVVMLFGPNSSGKSAVLDALKFVLPMCTTAYGSEDIQNSSTYRFSRGESRYRPKRDEDPNQLRSTLARCWRIDGGTWASHLKVGLEGRCEITGSHPFSFSWAWDFSWTLHEPDYDRVDNLDHVLEYNSRIVEFSVDGDWLCRINAPDSSYLASDDNVLTLNLKHTMLSESLKATLESDAGLFFAVPGLAEISDIDDSIQRIRHVFQGNDWRDFAWIDEDGNLACQSGWDISDDRKLRVAYEMYALQSATPNDLGGAKFLEVVYAKVNTLFELAGRVQMPYVVEDSRMIPSPRQLTYLIDSPSDAHSPIGRNVPNEYLASSATFRKLAEGFCAKLSHLNTYDPIFFESSEALLDNVNRLMSDFMFVDRGYQLDRTCLHVISEKEAGLWVTAAASGGVEEGQMDGQCLIKLELRDAKGDKYDFEEVGSGIGYSLPVLVGLANNSDQVVIAQPELHLHPALQSALGDAVLHSASHDHRILIETHSEHMLLRILRRIRQASKGLLDATDYPSATAEKVRVYYFEPHIDGSTRVHNLRISTEGEFLDPWPNGFFEERYEDLFDE